MLKIWSWHKWVFSLCINSLFQNTTLLNHPKMQPMFRFIAAKARPGLLITYLLKLLLTLLALLALTFEHCLKFVTKLCACVNSNQHRDGHLFLRNFDMQTIYFLVGPHVSAGVLRYDFSFPRLHFYCIYNHFL